MTTIYPQLAQQIAIAIEAIPSPNRQQPGDNMVVSSPDIAFQHLQDWAFVQGLAFVVEYRESTRVRWDCIFHKKETRNSRRMEEASRQYVSTFIRGTGCPIYFYVSKKKRQGDQWIFCYGKYLEHNHPYAIDPFSLAPHRSRRPGYLEARRITETHRGVVSFRASSGILQKMGLEIERKEFYNL
jgi:hypothetical protein